MQNVIYTNENNCRDCYKCVRLCPVDAISMINHSASVCSSRCIACGKCIDVCPAEAQNYRNDEGRVVDLLKSNKRVILSLAPSFVGEFDFSTDKIISMVKGIGFWGVSETALGAQLVSYNQNELQEQSQDATFSTACPTFVHYILKHQPELKSKLSPLLSPLLAHCTMLKQIYGNDISIVFAGPCIAKKLESDTNSELLDVAITFDELNNILANRDLINKGVNVAETQFIPCQGNGGAIYPLDGGMVETMKKMSPISITDTKYFNFSGINEIIKITANENFDKKDVFCEFLACKGGCINGSGLMNKSIALSKREKISNYYNSLEKYSEDSFINTYNLADITTEYNYCNAVEVNDHLLTEINEVFVKLRKFVPEDFLDCGGCGHDTCEKFAKACIDKRAEISMCVSSMRNEAQNKLRTFMHATPMGLCVVDNELKIVECNNMFLELSVDSGIDVTEGLLKKVEGRNINKFFNISELIKKVISSKEKLSKVVNIEDRIFSLTLFPFEVNMFVGVVIQDVTKSTKRKDIVTQKAQEVIKNNLMTIQKIAYLLGETASETEITLNEIVQAYKSD